MKHRFLKWTVGPGHTVGLVLSIVGLVGLLLMILGMMSWHDVHLVAYALMIGGGLYSCRSYYGQRILTESVTKSDVNTSADLGEPRQINNSDTDDLVAMMAAKVLTDERADTDDYMLASLALHPADGPSDNLDPYVAAALFDEDTGDSDRWDDD